MSSYHSPIGVGRGNWYGLTWADKSLSALYSLPVLDTIRGVTGLTIGATHLVLGDREAANTVFRDAVTHIIPGSGLVRFAEHDLELLGPGSESNTPSSSANTTPSPSTSTTSRSWQPEANPAMSEKPAGASRGNESDGEKPSEAPQSSSATTKKDLACLSKTEFLAYFQERLVFLTKEQESCDQAHKNLGDNGNSQEYRKVGERADAVSAEIKELMEKLQTFKTAEREAPSPTKKSEEPPPVPLSDSESVSGEPTSNAPVLSSSGSESGDYDSSTEEGSDYEFTSTTFGMPFSQSSEDEPPEVPPRSTTPSLPSRNNGSSGSSEVPDMPMASSSTLGSSEMSEDVGMAPVLGGGKPSATIVEECSETGSDDDCSTSDELDPEWEAQFGQPSVTAPTAPTPVPASPSTSTAQVANIIASGSAMNRSFELMAANRGSSSEVKEESGSWSE